MATCFIDTTTLLYSLDQEEPEKQITAREWLKTLRDTGQMMMSVQVLNECYWSASRKARFEAGRTQLREFLDGYRYWATAALDHDLLPECWKLQDRYGVQFWDGLLLASANRAGCRWFLSEDLNDGQLYGDVRAINPFRHAPQDVLGPRATS